MATGRSRRGLGACFIGRAPQGERTPRGDVVTGQWPEYAEARTTKAELLEQWDDATAQIDELFPKIPAARFQEVDTAFGRWNMAIYDLLGIEPPPLWERG